MTARRLLTTLVAAVVLTTVVAAPGAADPVGTVYDASGAETVLVGGGTLKTAGPFCASVGGLGDLVRCGVIRGTDAGRFAYVVLESKLGLQLVLYRRTAPGSWQELGGAAEPAPGGWTDVRVRAADVDTDGRREVVVGYRIAGTGQFLLLDVIDRVAGTLIVAAHIELEKGGARVEQGRIRTRAAEYAEGDPTCCPSNLDWSRVRKQSGAYRVFAQTIRPVTDAFLWQDQFA